YLKQHTKPSLIPFIKTTYPKSWIVRYMFKQYGAKDPVLKHVARHVKPYYWSDFPEFRDSKKPFYKDVLAHGLGNDGYCIPVHSTPNRFSLIILSSETPTEDFKKKVGKLDELLQKIANELHMKAIKETAL
ncbi:MAG: autoinducer binding domain-containing protein, partial [Nitratireductor sp.]